MIVERNDRGRDTRSPGRFLRDIAEAGAHDLEVPQQLDRALLAENAANTEVVAANVLPLAFVQRRAIRRYDRDRQEETAD